MPWYPHMFTHVELYLVYRDYLMNWFVSMIDDARRASKSNVARQRLVEVERYMPHAYGCALYAKINSNPAMAMADVKP